ncbi:hypothetical protein VTO42DRAFT_4106 [Malbranchea cinnamomea]
MEVSSRTPTPITQGHLLSPSISIPAALEDCPDISPCIEELLRTGYHPQSLLLRVERVIEVPIVYARPHRRDGSTSNPDCSRDPDSKNGDIDDDDDHGRQSAPRKLGEDAAAARSKVAVEPRHRTFRLFLGDNELVIQALLKKELHHFVSLGEVVPGAVMRLEAFELRWADRIRAGAASGDGMGPEEGGRGRMGKLAYLAVERFRTVWRPAGAGEKREGIERGETVVKKRVNKGDEKVSWKGHKRLRSGSGDVDLPMGRKEDPRHENSLEVLQTGVVRDSSLVPAGDVQEEAPGLRHDASEASQSRPAKDRSIEIAKNRERVSYSSPHEHGEEMKLETSLHKRSASTPPHRRPQTGSHPLNSPSSSSDPILTPPNLVTLSALLDPTKPFPRRNTIVSIFGVIASVNSILIQPPLRTRLPAKRELRILDSSLPLRSSGVKLSVFVDAEKFLPPVGTVGLFMRLSTHEWEGLSLNAFEWECAGKEWFVTDEERLATAGLDVASLKKWWEKRCAALGG